MHTDTEVSRIVLSAAWSKIPMPCLVDLNSGEMSNVCFFQATLGESKMPFIKAYPCKEQKYWVWGLIDAIDYYGGLPALIAPRAHNAPKIPGYLSPSEDSAFDMLSKFYGIPILPVNLRDPALCIDIDAFRPPDWIVRQLRDKVFYSLDELNDHTSLLLTRYVTLPSSTCNNSRLNIFRTKDKPMLGPLPQQRFSVIEVATRVVGDNCFIKYGSSYYSVPYTYCKQKVNLHVSKSEIAIFDICGVHLASHKLDENNKYVIEPSHMPPKHKLFGYPVYDGSKYVEWAAHIGGNTRSVIECLLATADYEQQAFRSCIAILQLSKKYGNSRLDSACKAAKFYGCICFSAIKRLTINGVDPKALFTAKPTSNDYIQLKFNDDGSSF